MRIFHPAISMSLPVPSCFSRTILCHSSSHQNGSGVWNCVWSWFYLSDTALCLDPLWTKGSWAAGWFALAGKQGAKVLPEPWALSPLLRRPNRKLQASQALGALTYWTTTHGSSLSSLCVFFTTIIFCHYFLEKEIFFWKFRLAKAENNWKRQIGKREKQVGRSSSFFFPGEGKRENSN